MPPTSSFAAVNLDNDDFLNARPNTNEYDDLSPVQLASYASSEPEDDNFLVGEEEDGGILIEPDQLSGELNLWDNLSTDIFYSKIGRWVNPRSLIPFTLYIAYIFCAAIFGKHISK